MENRKKLLNLAKLCTLTGSLLLLEGTLRLIAYGVDNAKNMESEESYATAATFTTGSSNPSIEGGSGLFGHGLPEVIIGGVSAIVGAVSFIAYKKIYLKPGYTDLDDKQKKKLESVKPPKSKQDDKSFLNHAYKPEDDEDLYETPGTSSVVSISRPSFSLKGQMPEARIDFSKDSRLLTNGNNGSYGSTILEDAGVKDQETSYGFAGLKTDDSKGVNKETSYGFAGLKTDDNKEADQEATYDLTPSSNKNSEETMNEENEYEELNIAGGNNPPPTLPPRTTSKKNSGPRR